MTTLPAATGGRPDPVPGPPPPDAPCPGPDEATEPRPRISNVGTLWAWGWLSIVHLVLDLLLSAPFLVIGVIALVGVVTLPALLAGLPFLAVALVIGMGLGALERLRLQSFTGVCLAPPPAPRYDQPLWRRLVFDSRPWKAQGYLFLIALWGLTAGLAILVLLCVALALAALPFYAQSLPNDRLSMPLGGSIGAGVWPWLTAVGVAGLLVIPLVARAMVTVDLALGRLLLGRSRQAELKELSQRVQTLTETRVATVDSVEMERRRIERDLHDGPQQRLVAIAMDIGMAREKLDRDVPGARELLDKAHVAAKEAITEMRQVARGIAPPVLTDRGLDAALSALAARAPLPVDVAVELPRRPSPTVEAIAYFCVSEALTNVAKHSRATRVRVDVWLRDDLLVVRVLDDGVGGADPSRGTGLVGLTNRVRAVDGNLEVSSPTGGPTLLTVQLPVRRAPGAVPDRPPAGPPAPGGGVPAGRDATGQPPGGRRSPDRSPSGRQTPERPPPERPEPWPPVGRPRVWPPSGRRTQGPPPASTPRSQP
ncbi:MAG: sensor histidine kinase [Actinomycetales bacterium]|nr:sensor histidine kinase [Actinomycetales bacterium]